MSEKKFVWTVTGPVPVEKLGRCLIHEHLIWGAPGYWGDYGRYDDETIVKRIVEELETLKPYGVKTIVDATPIDCGRRADLLKEASLRCGLNSKKNILLLLMGMNVISAAGLMFANGIAYVILIQVAVMAYGGPVGIVSAMVTESFGTEHAGINSGVVFLFSGLSSLIFPRAAALINVATETYQPAFVVGIIACAIPAVLVMGHDKAVKTRLEKEAYYASFS